MRAKDMIDVGRGRFYCQYELYAICLCEVCNFTRQTDAIIPVRRSDFYHDYSHEAINNSTPLFVKRQ